MKAESIEQIREHLARGGRVMCHWNNQNASFRKAADSVWSVGLNDIIVDSWSRVVLAFDSSYVDHWELLPIDEPPSFRDFCARIIIDGRDTGAGGRIRTALLYGRRPEMSDLLEWWQATTGERIEHGERCAMCECSGKIAETRHSWAGTVRCPACNGSGYTVRPTWMEEQTK